jgi:uncharacterized repeat protein (TIGR01451 family)
VTCTLITGPLNVGDVWKVKIVFEAPAKTDIGDTVNVTAGVINGGTFTPDINDPNKANNLASDVLHIESAADLRLAKQATGEEQQVNQPGLIFNSALFGQPFPTGPNYFASIRVTAGRRIHYSVTVTNNGPSPANNVVLTDRLPAGVQLYQGSLIAEKSVPNGLVTILPTPCETGTPGQPLDKMVCGLGTIEVGQSVFVNFQVITDASLAPGTVLENDANVTSDAHDLDTSDNHAFAQNTVLTAADMSVSKTGVGKVLTGYDATKKQYVYADTPNEVSAGSLLRYNIAVQNNGPSDAQNVTVQDNLPAGVRFKNADGATCMSDEVNQNLLFCYAGKMIAGARKSFDLYVEVDPALADGVVLKNTALVLPSPSNTSPPGAPPVLPPGFPQGPLTWDPLTSNNEANQNTTVHVNFDLSIRKTSDADTYKPSSTVKYTITVVNNGPSDVDNVVVRDDLPPPKQAKYLFDDAGCTWDGAKVLTCDLGPMAPGETKQFEVYVTIFGSKGQISNTATITSGAAPFDVYAPNNTSTRVILVQGAKFAKK